MASRLKLNVRRFATFIEESPANPPLRKVAVAAIFKNPYAGQCVDDLSPLIEASESLGKEVSAIAITAMQPYLAQSYGKAALVGLAGEQEHANAIITTTFAEPMRRAVGGGKAWISSFTKRVAPGCSIDIPLAFKDALYVRSHYDGMSVTFHDAPLEDELVAIVCMANRGRLNARVGGLAVNDVKGLDGLT